MSCLIFMLLHDDERNLIEYVPLLLLWMNFLDYFYIHQSFQLNIEDLHNKWYFPRFFLYLLSSNILVSSEYITTLPKSLFSYIFLKDSHLFSVLKE